MSEHNAVPGDGAVPDDEAPLGVTGAALLGLLALRPWTTYELAKQAKRSLQWFWPRAERKLYDEPKKLAARGYATTEVQATGKRRSTVYTITPAGRKALRRWLGAEPETPITVEIEQLVRVFFADQGSPDQLRAAIERAGQQAEQNLAELGAIVASASMDDAVLRERDAVTSLGLKLVLELHRTTAEWARWAGGIVTDWDTTRHPDWDGDAAVRAEAMVHAPPR